MCIFAYIHTYSGLSSILMHPFPKHTSIMPPYPASTCLPATTHYHTEIPHIPVKASGGMGAIGWAAVIMSSTLRHARAQLVGQKAVGIWGSYLVGYCMLVSIWVKKTRIMTSNINFCSKRACVYE